MVTMAEMKNKMDRNTQKEFYIEFLKKCTRNPNSAKNYSDFKRINECLKLLFPDKEDISIFDFDDAEEFSKIIARFNTLPKYIEYNKKGNNQYSNTVAFYLCFLNAKRLFSGTQNTSVERIKIAEVSLQQIYYGAPGTGKSHIINELTKGESVIRTTFHPDSDYSTFVGAYKPTMGLLPICNELGQPMEIGSSVLHKEQIIYEFVHQAFLQAYVNAWKYYADNSEEIKKKYLIIEEINRGNCAQVFGDLFQLLDRNDHGFSVYPINADKDMKKYLEKAFKGVRIECSEGGIGWRHPSVA